MTRVSPTSICAPITSFRKLAFYRGARSQPGRYFGPFPNAGAVRETLQGLQKLFRIRNCRDSFFANRTRPCLQHQIGRCSAPCVGLIDAATYGQDVDAAVKVLEGRSQEVNAQLRERDGGGGIQAAVRARRADPRSAGGAGEYPVTADRDRRGWPADADAFAIVGEPGEYAISVMLIRGGRNLGTTSYFPRAALADPDEALGSFILQYYTAQEPPAEVLLGLALPDSEAMGEVLRTRAAHAVTVRRPVARHRRPLGGTDAGKCGAGAAHAPGTAPQCRRDAGGPGRGAGPGAGAPAYRVLRHQPYRRGGHGRLLRGVRTRRAAEEGIPALQHCRHHPGR